MDSFYVPVKQRLPVRAFNLASDLLHRVGRRDVGFAASEQAFLDAACEATGYSDYGDAAFRAPLRILLEAYDSEAHLHPMGRRMVRQLISGILQNRLRAERAWSEAPSILSAEIRRPIFVIGCPRTGTTALHHLLGCDPAHQILEYWLAAAPKPRPPVERWRTDPAFKAAERSLKLQYFLDPSLKAIHLMTPDLPEECRHLLQQGFADDTFECCSHVPSYSAWYANTDMRPVYERHRDLLKLIGAHQPADRWVLKYGPHLRHLGALAEVYPDACFVWTHRDPATVIPSFCSLVAGWRGIYEDRVDRLAIGRWVRDLWADAFERAMEVRRVVPHQFFDLHYRVVVEDPVAAVGRIYEHFGVELSGEAEQRMRAFQSENPQGRHGKHVYSAEQFGLSRGELAERFGAYVAEFQVEAE